MPNSWLCTPGRLPAASPWLLPACCLLPQPPPLILAPLPAPAPHNLSSVLCPAALQDDWTKTQAIIYVTAAQLMCGVAKDLTKLGGKTVTKLVTPGGRAGGRREGMRQGRQAGPQLRCDGLGKPFSCAALQRRGPATAAASPRDAPAAAAPAPAPALQMRSRARCSSWSPSSPGGRTASRARDTSWGQPPWASSERLPAAQRSAAPAPVLCAGGLGACCTVPCLAPL